MEKITLKGMRSTCSVMDWIEANDCPVLNCQHFDFPDDPRPFYGHMFPSSLVVSSVNPESSIMRPILARYPVEEWHKVKPSQLRLNCNGRMWYACINGKYYYMTD